MKKNTSRTKINYRKAIRTLFRFGREKTTCPERRRPKRNSFEKDVEAVSRKETFFVGRYGESKSLHAFPVASPW